MQKKKQKLSNILGEGDLQAIGDVVYGIVDKQVATLISKKDLESAEFRIKTELKEYMHEGFESVMKGVDSLADQMADKQAVEKLEDWATKAGSQIGLRVND